MPHGKLTVVVESATGIKDPTLDGRGDSYCTLQCGSQVLSTHVAEGGSSQPIFHTEFKFEIDRSTNELAVSVYSKATVGEDELVGFTVLDFKQVFYHGHTVPLTAYALSRSPGKSGGYINISLKFKSRPSPYAQNAHAPVRQHSAPPQRAVRNQHNPLRQSYPTGTEAYETYEEGYGSSGSDSSRSSRGSGSRSSYRRSQSQPEQYYDESPQVEEYYAPIPHYYQEASPHPQHAHPRPSPVAPAGPRRPIPGGPQLHLANPYPQQQQQPPRAAMYANPNPQGQGFRPQVPPVRYQQPAQAQRQQPPQQGPSMGAQVATAVAAGVAKATVQGLFGLLTSDS